MKTACRMLIQGVAVSLWGLCAVGAMAHHSTAIYDNDNPVELTGKVVEWRFVNPHCIIMLEVAGEEGESRLWTLEGPNTSLIVRRGWTPVTLEPGDEILVTVRPLRSGAHGGNYSNPRWADGTRLDPASDR